MVSGLYLLLPTILVIFFSFLIVRAAAIALMMTGMDESRARFQARSAFTGTGFTTREAELVVNHPKRRQIISWLMVLGNAGIITIIVTGTSSLVGSEGIEIPIDILGLLVGIFLIYKIGSHTGFTRRWERFIEDRLSKSAVLEEEITEKLLHFLEGYSLVRVMVKKDSSLVGKTLDDEQLTEKRLLVLGIERGSNWIPVPSSDQEIKEDDRLVVYGPLKVLRNTFG
ncbi:MAG: TrkA C-terminal domain-containing protein [Archaeoglobaceae archaeon]